MRLDTLLPNHGFIEPGREMPLADYRRALEATQSGWTVEPWEA